MKGYREFEFDLPSALLTRLTSVLDEMEAEILSPEYLANVPETQGVYQLLLENKPVYIGKTDAEAGLNKRLIRHSRKILHRKSLEPTNVEFKAVRVYVFTAMDLESDLIHYYGGVRSLAWNGSGFGSNDPGRRRDSTRVDDENFDAIYPIDIDRELSFTIQEGETAASASARLKNELPYVFRYQNAGGRSRKAHPDFETTILAALSGPTTARQAVSHIVSSLPSGWQATGLPGYVIAYKEHVVYPKSEVIVRS